MRRQVAPLLLALAAGIAQALTVNKELLDPAIYPAALCNDGTPAAYYTRVSRALAALSACSHSHLRS